MKKETLIVLVIVILLIVLAIWLLNKKNVNTHQDHLILTVSSQEALEGWYEGTSCYDPIIHVDANRQVQVFTVHGGSGAYTLNQHFLGNSYNMKKIGTNVYAMADGITYQHDPSNGTLTLQDVLFIDAQYSYQFRKVVDADNRYWQYSADLQNSSKVFNSPSALFDVAYNSYLSGFGSAFHRISSQLLPGSALKLDYSQYRGSYGALSASEYASLYHQLLKTGITRSYNIKRFIYWPYPTFNRNWSITNDQKAKLRWVVNQNRYNYLAFVPAQQMSPDFCRLCPGERVIMRGSGTRLDGFPLRLSLDGFHTGPNPGPKFSTTAPNYNLAEEWELYSIRLPMIIDASNDTIWTDNEFDRITPRPFTLRHGTWYFSEIMNMLHDAWNSYELDMFLDPGNFIMPEMAILGHLLICNTGNVYGPNHPMFPSNFFGPNGMDIGYLFHNDTIAALSLVEIKLLGDGQYPGYKSHTPLSAFEAQQLLNNINFITIEAQHGPIRDDMPYDSFIACVNELSMAKSTEDHSLIAAWVHMAEQGDGEIPSDMSKLQKILANRSFPDTYDAPYTLGDANSGIFAPDIWAHSIRCTGTGHPGEFSENYAPMGTGLMYNSLSRGEGRLDWLAPRGIGWYPEGTITSLGDLSGRGVDVVAVNHLDNPRWLAFDIAPNGILGGDVPRGSPTYKLVPYATHENRFAYRQDGKEPSFNPEVSEGDWLIGTIKESVVRQALKIPTSKVPVIGYITHASTALSSHKKADVTLLPWYQAEGLRGTVYDSFDSNPLGIMAAASILREFNKLGVEHIIIDQRDTIGGGSPMWGSLQRLIGGDRGFRTLRNIYNSKTITENSSTKILHQNDLIEQLVLEGKLEPKFSHPFACRPTDWLNAGVPKDCVWSGVVTKKRANILWYSNMTTISATQQAYCSWNDSMDDKIGYNGDLGNNTHFIGYGVYNRPFSTGGGYYSYARWYGKHRTGTEEVKAPLLPALDRWEFDREGYIDGNGIVKGLDQEFNRLHEPHIKWDMNADVFFRDIGYVIGNPGVNEQTDGRPWLTAAANRSDVVFDQPLTWKDSVLIRSIQMLNDPELEKHYYKDDGYGYVTTN